MVTESIATAIIDYFRKNGEAKATARIEVHELISELLIRLKSSKKYGTYMGGYDELLTELASLTSKTVIKNQGSLDQPLKSALFDLRDRLVQVQQESPRGIGDGRQIDSLNKLESELQQMLDYFEKN